MAISTVVGKVVGMTPVDLVHDGRHFEVCLLRKISENLGLSTGSRWDDSEAAPNVPDVGVLMKLVFGRREAVVELSSDSLHTAKPKPPASAAAANSWGWSGLHRHEVSTTERRTTSSRTASRPRQ